MQISSQMKKPRTPGLIDGVGVITRDYWRYAANYISFFLFLAAHGGGLRGRKRKHSTLLLNKWLKENIPGLMLIWSGTLGRFSLFRLFSLFLFFFWFVFQPCTNDWRGWMSDTWSSSAVVASRCVGECERPPVGAHWAQLARGNLQPSDRSSENTAEPQSRKEK